METESGIIISRGWEEWEMESCCWMGMEFQFRKMTVFILYIVQQYEYTKHYCTVHLKMVEMINFVLSVF